MLNIEDSALVIIDIQDRLVQASKYGAETAQNMVKLSKAASILGIPTLVTEQYPAGLGLTVAELRETFNDNTFTTEKTAFSAMLEPAFKEKIQSLGKKQIIIGGIETQTEVTDNSIGIVFILGQEFFSP